MGIMNSARGRAMVHNRIHTPHTQTLPPSNQLQGHQSSRRSNFLNSQSATPSATNLQRASFSTRIRLKNQTAQATENELPIMKHRDEIVRAVSLSDVTIIVAPTGTGKSTQVAQFLIESGFEVLVTQPRRLAAMALGTRVSEEQGCKLGQGVGFRHALADATSAQTKLIYTTDGYQLVRELHNPVSADSVIILDESHEYNANMEALFGLFKKRQRIGAAPKIVIMSATLNAEKVSAFWGGAPIINVERRMFPITEREPGSTMAADITQLARERKNTLVFLPGKGEIQKMQQQLLAEGLDAEVLPLHSQLSRDEQELVFKHYDRPKIILATNIAQTSITIDDIDAVVSSGLVRRLSLINNVPTLLIESISQDEFFQQKGRVGRTHAGIFIYHGQPFDTLRVEAPAEIQHIPLDTLTLRLLAGGENIRSLDLLHRPSTKHLDAASSALFRLNLIGPQGHLTNQGRQVAELPVDTRTGKMLVKANLTAKKHAHILPLAIDLAAIIESEGILLNESKDLWRQHCPAERGSDLIAQMLVFHKGLTLPPEQLAEHGIDQVGFRRAVEMRTLLRRRIGMLTEQSHDQRLSDESIARTNRHSKRTRFEWHLPIEKAESQWIPDKISSNDFYLLREALWTGFADSIFRLAGKHSSGDPLYKSLSGSGLRRLNRDSVIGSPSFIVGTPFDIAVLNESGTQKIVKLVQNASAVNEDWLTKNRPHELRQHLKSVFQQIRENEARAKNKGSDEKFRRTNGFRNGRK